MLDGDYTSGVRTSVFQKDLRLIGDFAADHDVATPLLDVDCRPLRGRGQKGHADEDTAAVFEILPLAPPKRRRAVSNRRANA